MLNKIKETADFLKAAQKTQPKTGIILGTGLGGLVKEIVMERTIPYNEIPHFPLSTVEGHQGKLIFGTIKGSPVMAMQGRFHYYEGYNMKEVTFPVRVMQQMGISNLVVSNASEIGRASCRERGKDTVEALRLM